MKNLRWRRIVLGSYAGLWFTLCAWYFVFDPPQFVFALVLRILFLAILLLPLKGLLTNNPRVYMWSSYLMLIYFAHAVIETYANSEMRYFAVLELVFSMLYFIAATFCARTASQESRSLR